VLGVAELGGDRLFVLRFLQSRDPDWTARPFFARYDPHATWFDELVPAGAERFFFAEGLERMCAGSRGPTRGRLHGQTVVAGR
jgi:hypothetical protein